MDETSFLMKKEVDWSLLNKGVAIPISLQRFFCDRVQRKVPRGSVCKIQVMLDGEMFEVALHNYNIDKTRNAEHSDLMHLQWGSKSPIAQALQAKFSSSYSILKAQRSTLPAHAHIRLDESQIEHFVMYLTNTPGVIAAECITKADFADAKSSILRFDELGLERLLDKDDIGSIAFGSQLAKYRKLDRTFGEELKKAYGCRCQICGLPIGAEYGTRVSNTHHIEYFSRSLDNSPSNLLIVCPNHHSIIHATDPLFIRETASFKYPNGYEEKLKLNEHLSA
jgi:hypothetical protein